MAAARGPTLGPSGESGPLEILEDHTKKPVRKHGLPLSAGPAIKLRAGGGSELNTRRWLVPGRRTPLSSIPYIIIKQSRRPCPPHKIWCPGNSGQAPAVVSALGASAARLVVVAGASCPPLRSGLIQSFSWGFCSSWIMGPMFEDK